MMVVYPSNGKNDILSNTPTHRKFKERNIFMTVTLTFNLPKEAAKKLTENEVAHQAAEKMLAEAFGNDDPYQRLRRLAVQQATDTKALFAAWEQEDETSDEAEKERRDQEAEALRQGLNANRAATSERLHYSEKI
jgi:uncharacterized protein with ATP-grasp and redox domains